MINFDKNRFKGIMLAIFGASFWGLGGAVSDFLFQKKHIDINWYVTARLLISGIMLLLFFKVINTKQSLFAIFKSVKSIIHLFIFSMFGMLLVQYSYMASIHYGNAAVATLLQYIAPVYIILWYIVRDKEKLKLMDCLTIILTLLGTFLLLTNGSINKIIVSMPGFIWGIISGVALAFYTLYVKRLLINYSSILVVGWSMTISGILMNFKTPIWNIDITNLDLSTNLYLSFGIIAGTTLAFLFFITSLNYLTAKETALFGTIEPVMAIVASAIWLKVTFLPFQLLGIFLIITLILLISFQKNKD